MNQISADLNIWRFYWNYLFIPNSTYYQEIKGRLKMLRVPKHLNQISADLNIWWFYCNYLFIPNSTYYKEIKGMLEFQNI